MNKFSHLTNEELHGKLHELRDLLEEVTEERMMILGQENIHLSSKVVNKYENELKDIREDIALVEKLISENKE